MSAARLPPRLRGCLSVGRVTQRWGCQSGTSCRPVTDGVSVEDGHVNRRRQAELPFPIPMLYGQASAQLTTFPRIPTLSLFSGAGGLDLGFEQAGFEIVACVEIEPAYCRSLEANRGTFFPVETEVHCQDIRDFNPAPFKRKHIQCVIGGPPCQTFSAAGRRSGGVIGTEDQRGQLYSAYCRILDELEPEVFVFENVYGLPGANGGGPWREINAAFESHGYSLYSTVVDAADYGVPQHRERLIMVGTRSAQFVFPLPTHGPDSPTKAELVSVEAAIGDIQEPHERYHHDLGGLYGHLLPEVPEGLNYAFFTAEMGHPQPVFAWRSKFHDLLYKVNRQEPCRTLKASPGKFTGPFHWKNRHFTVEELKRLQTVPDEYALVGSYAKVLEQIGNSVPPQLAYVVAVSVRQQLLQPTAELTYPVRHATFKSTFRQRQRERSAQFKAVARKAIEERFGRFHGQVEPSASAQAKSTRTYCAYQDLFTRRTQTTRPSTGDCIAIVESTEFRRHLRLDMDFVEPKRRRVGAQVDITGLRKYLPDYDSLTLHGVLGSHDGIFHLWQEIEDALVSRSHFFTLIDIYGHYANRGDVVNVTAAFNFRRNGPLERAIKFFSQTNNCGYFQDDVEAWATMGIGKEDVRSVVANMRGLRFDLRTAATHPIIGTGRLICTYPFPLLSPRALVESRVTLDRQKEQGDVAEAIEG
ncbi:MAG: DNA cytosine methyltransferase [Chloroflexi bacterium]|nr:DNA cytosine methyltransferase [Chloroflexota bacterium]